MSITNDKFVNNTFCIYALYKVFVIFIAVYYIQSITTLGDTNRFLSSNMSFNEIVWTRSTDIMDWTGSIAGRLPVFTKHFPLAFLSYIFMWYLVAKLRYYGLLEGTSRKVILVVFLFSPSFTLWSSLHSKDAIGVACVAYFCSRFIDVIYGHVYRLSILDCVIAAILSMFKPQYFLPIVSGLSVIFIFRARCSARKRAVFLATMFITQVILFCIFSDLIDQLSFQMHKHFAYGNGRSTRENIFLESGDFFYHAYYGLIVAFVGPTVTEVIRSSFMVIPMLEGATILLILFLFMSFSFNCKKLDLIFVFSLVLMFWVLLVHYPFGIFNPGSAVRYRTNIIPFFVLMTFCLLKGRAKLWSNKA